MTIATPTEPATRAADDARLAADLGRLLEEIFDHTAEGLAVPLVQHDIDPLQLRLLRLIQQSLAPDTTTELARRAEIDPALVDRVLLELAARGLITDPGDGFGLTATGSGVVADITQARRNQLLDFVSTLSDRRRPRFVAAVHLLSAELDLA